ncbi:MAG: CRTAC1 family protein [Candidatus Hinthialibacter antarcticus]|nr:CRTAC1 family protein [Candidatus Hinthialibacter antarcticus]
MRILNEFMRTAAVAACMLFLCQCGPQEEIEPDAPNPETYAKREAPTPQTKSKQTNITFTNVTQQAGVDFIHENGYSNQKYMPETMGSGGGFFDYDNDGDLDLFLVNSRWFDEANADKPPTYSALYRNDGDWKFTNVTQDAGLQVNLYGMGCYMADVDADGDLDLFLTAAIDGQRFYRNNGDGTFSDATEASGLAAPKWSDDEGREHPYWSTGAAFFDYDRDGWLDLVVCHYVQWSIENDIFTTRAGMGKSFTIPTLYKGLTPLLYHNNGDGTYSDVTKQAGVYNPNGKSLGVALADYNQDGWLDFAISNDSVPNFLYINTGDGSFEESALIAGVAFDENGRARAGMGIDFAPALDGQWSLAIGNFSHEPISLYTRMNEMFFVDQAGKARISRPSLVSLTFGLAFFDYDLDGWLDLAAANGHIEPDIHKVEKNITFKQPPQIFHNMNGEYYEDISSQLGDDFAPPMVARGAAYGDLDQDGDLDLLLTGCGERPRLLRNDNAANSNHWVRLKLRGNAPNLDAIGATVTLTAGGRERVLMVKTGSSYLSQSEFALTFGLGNETTIERVEIQWPDGTSITLSEDELATLAIKKTHIINQ